MITVIIKNMDHSGEKPKFEIQPVIEQRPFENPPVLLFFNEWCKINDSIELEIISREEWEKRKNILERQPDGELTLFIPRDLQLWEMVGVMEIVDRDTFATKPERQTEAKEKLQALAKIFQNTGIYIAQRIKYIPEGREIAEALAQEFYEYGQSLELGQRPETQPTIEELANQNLTSEETETIDRFLAGEKLLESRRRRVKYAITLDPSKKEKEEELYEKERQRTLAQFFRVAQKAFELESKSRGGELQKSKTELKPWQSNAPIHSAFLERIKKAIAQKIETPKRELNMAIFRRGLEKLVREMKVKAENWKPAVREFFKNLGLDLKSEEKKLVDALDIHERRAQLEAVRQTGDLIAISQKEREIADIIQMAVYGFPYKYYVSTPSEIVAYRLFNCVGASILGGALMKEAGLNYLVGTLPRHSILLLVTSDGNVEWRDMISPSSNELLTDEMIEGRNKDGKPLTVKDIVAFAQNPTPEGLMFDIKREKKKLAWLEEGQRQYLAVFGPEYGQLIQLLYNTCFALYNTQYYSMAVEALQQVIALNPKFPAAYNDLGNIFYFLESYDEAIEAYRQAIVIDSKFAPYYRNLGDAFRKSGRYEEATEAYQQAIEIDPNSPGNHYYLGLTLHTLGRHNEAIKALNRFLELASTDEEKYGSQIKKAKQMIKELESSSES